MSARLWVKLAEILVPVLLAITIFVSWQADRRDRAQLVAQLAAAQKTIADATASQHDRDAALSLTLAQIAAQKQAAVTPAQMLNDLPGALSLPAPITLLSNHPGPHADGKPAVLSAGDMSKAYRTTPGQPDTLPDNPSPKSGQPADAVLPAADLRPLYDFALDCKACQAKLAASQSDLADERVKTVALTKQRDAAVRTAKGGSALRRIARAAKWFAIGAAAGAIAAKASR